MVHELLGVTTGRVSLAHVPGVSDELKELVMAPTQVLFISHGINFFLQFIFGYVCFFCSRY